MRKPAYRLLLSSVSINLLTLALAANSSWAQEPTIKYTEGPGVKLTDDLVFHPGIGLETRYDSNVFFSKAAKGAFNLKVFGHLDLATLPPQRLTDGSGQVSQKALNFRLKSAISYSEYFSDNAQVKDQRGVEADVGLKLHFLPGRVFQFELFDDYARTVSARNSVTSLQFKRHTNRAGSWVVLAPGGGRLTLKAGYDLIASLYEDADLSVANKLYHMVKFQGRWKLLPRTSIGIDVTEQIIRYTDSLSPNSSSNPFRITATLQGLITSHLSTLLYLGYGNGFYDTGASFSSVVALAEFAYHIGPLATIKVGYERLFDDADFVSNYFTDHKVYLGYDHFIASRFMLHLMGDYRFREHDGIAASVGVTELKYHVLTLGFGLDFQVQEWLFIGVNYNLELRDQTTGALSFGGAPSSFVNDFAKHLVGGKIQITY